MYGPFLHMLKLLQSRDSRKNETYDAKVLAYNKDSAVIFDIFCTDACQRRKSMMLG